MNKNVKRIFYVGLLFVLLVGVTSVSASEVSDDMTILEDASDAIAPETTHTTISDNTVETTKDMEKEDKNIKTATKTVELNNMNELTTAITNAVQDSENDEYIINLNEGNYMGVLMLVQTVQTKYPKNFIINGNNQTLTGPISQFANSCNYTFSDVKLQLSNTIGGTGLGVNTALTSLTLNHATISAATTIYAKWCFDHSKFNSTSKFR